MRKEVRSIGVGTAAHIVDRVVRQTGILELQPNQRSEISMGLAVTSIHHGSPAGCPFHLSRHLFTDLERADPNVRADRGDEISWLVGQRLDGRRHDASNRAPPARMHCGDVTARRVRNQDRHAIGRTGSYSKSLRERHERVPLGIGNRRSVIGVGDFAHVASVHLTLLEKAIEGKTELLCKTRPVLPHRIVIVAQVKPEVERVVRRSAHAAGTGRKRMTKPVPIQKGGMESAHSVVCSTASLREPTVRAKSSVFQVRAGSCLVHRFPSVEWTNALRVTLNNDRAYREAGKPWTFGSVAMIVRSDPGYGLEQDAGIILDVHRGECRGARFVEGDDDPQDAEFVIVGTYARWRDVIEGRLDPIKAMMEGKLKLARGHLPTIIRFVEPSRLVVASASKVPTRFAD